MKSRFLSPDERDFLGRDDDEEQQRPELGQPAPSPSPGGLLSDEQRAFLSTEDEPPEPEGPALDSAGRVWVQSERGRLGTVEPGLADKLAPGLSLAPRALVERHLQKEENESALGIAKTVGEQGLEGLTLGGYGAIAKAVDPEYRARMDQREEDNPGSAIAGNVIGTALPALVTGGTGLLARGAAMTPAALASRAALATSQSVAKKFGTSAIGRVAATALGGAVEGGTVAAVQKIADEAPNFTTDPTEAAEHVLYAAAEGAMLGGAVGGGLQLGGEAVRGAVRGGAYAAQKMGASLGDLAPTPENLERWAGANAYKAVVGRTNRNAMRKADRFHGDEEMWGDEVIGNTLLKEQLPLYGPKDKIADAIHARTDEVGARIGDMVKQADQLGGVPVDRAEIMAAIDEQVIGKLRENTWAQPLVKRLEVEIAPFREKMAQGGPISFQELNQERRWLQETINYETAGPPTAIDKLRSDIRTVMEGSWMSGAERAAASVGKPGFADEFQNLKTTYSHLKQAGKEADEALFTERANRNFSLTDNLQGIGASSALGGGPVGMAAGVGVALGHRYIRQNGRGLAAIALHQMAAMAQQQGSLVAMASSGQARVARAAQGFVQGVQQAKYALPGAAVATTLSEQDLASAIAEARELQNPNSPAQQQLTQNAKQMDMLNPGMGVAYANAAHARSKLITGKLPPPPTVGVFAPQPVLDPITDRLLRRTVTAAMDPQRALERIAQGTHSPEDVEAIRTVYPRTFQRFQQQVQQQLKTMKGRPNYETRVRISTVIGVPADPSMEIDNLRLQQQVAQGPDTQAIEEGKAEAKNRQDAASMNSPTSGSKPGAGDKFRDPFNAYAGPVDSRIDRR